MHCYNFNAAEVTVPFLVLTTWKRDMPYNKSKKLIAINYETPPGWNISGPHIYLSTRPGYNPNADADAIMNEYFQGFFGPAAPFMKEQLLDDYHSERSDAGAQSRNPAGLVDQYSFLPSSNNRVLCLEANSELS